MAAEENAPLGDSPETGGAVASEGEDGKRRTLGLIFGLLVVAALLIVAGVLLRSRQSERVSQGTPTARPVAPGVGAPPNLLQSPGR